MNVGHCAAETGTGNLYLTKEMPTCKNYNKKHLAFRALRPGFGHFCKAFHIMPKEIKKYLNGFFFFRCSLS